MMLRVFRNWAMALGCAALCGCAEGEKSACARLKYTEGGVERRAFVPCAAAMVRQLDRAGAGVETMADRSKPGGARGRAQRECLAATAALARLLREAGGTQKLTATWEDTRLNEFSLAVISAKDEYLTMCYYGPKLFDAAEVRIPGSVRAHDKARAILPEIR